MSARNRMQLVCFSLGHFIEGRFLFSDVASSVWEILWYSPDWFLSVTSRSSMLTVRSLLSLHYILILVGLIFTASSGWNEAETEHRFVSELQGSSWVSPVVCLGPTNPWNFCCLISFCQLTVNLARNSMWKTQIQLLVLVTEGTAGPAMSHRPGDPEFDPQTPCCRRR